MKMPMISPFGLIELSLRNAMMMSEAGMIIWMRMMGVGGMWRVTPSENARMVEEKFAAVMEGATAASRVAMRGGHPFAIVDAGMKPARKRTSANVKRLAKRGPGKPT